MNGDAMTQAASPALSAPLIRGGEFLFVAGLTATDLETGLPFHGTVKTETRQILLRLERLLRHAGSSLDRVVKVNVLLHSMLEAPNMEEAYAPFFPGPPPARTVAGATLPGRARVMLECTALA